MCRYLYYVIVCDVSSLFSGWANSQNILCVFARSQPSVCTEMCNSRRAQSELCNKFIYIIVCAALDGNVYNIHIYECCV